MLGRVRHGCSNPWTLAALLFVVNASLCRELYGVEYLDQRQSIEGAYAGLARWIREHPFDSDWFPLWYAGIPFQNSYPPVLHYLVAALSALLHTSTSHAHHIVGATMYAVQPVGLFLLGYRLSHDRWASFFSGALMSLLTFAGISADMARDMGSEWGLRRLQVLVQFGEAPHLTSLAILPFALAALDAAVNRPRPLRLLLAAVFYAIVVLSNWLGAFALAIATLCYLAAFVGRGWRHQLGVSFGIAILAYSLAAPWIPPSTISTISHNAQYTVGHYPLTPIHALYGAGVLAGLVVSVGLMVRLKLPPAVRFAILFTVMMGLPPLIWLWTRVPLIPQPDRYHIEAEMGLALVVGLIASALLRRIAQPVRGVLIAALVIAGGLQYREGRRYALEMIRPLSIEETIEFQVSRWCAEHLPHDRVYAAGTVRFWLEAFSDTSQLGGGFDQGVTNSHLNHLHFGVLQSIGDGERAAEWLRAFGASAVIVSGPGSQEMYKDFRDSTKFESILPVLWTNGTDTIYQIPCRQNPIVRIVPQIAVVDRLNNPYTDTAPLALLTRALNDPAIMPAALDYVSSSHLRIKATLPAQHVLSVAISWHPGWSATCNGEVLSIRSDALGLMVIDPGPHTGPIALSYNGGLEMRIARALRLAAIIVMAVWILVDWRRRHSE